MSPILLDLTDERPTLDVREALRRATAGLHSQVDTMMPLAQPSPSLLDYRQHLELLLQWTQRLPRLPVVAERLDQQAAQLQSDLDICAELLGASPQVMPVASRPTDVQADASLGWGVAYVIEGSHLGGQMMFRKLAEALSPHPLDYLRGAGKATGARWTAFLAELRNHVRTDDEVRQACQGAVHAFELLIDCHRAGKGTTP